MAKASYVTKLNKGLVLAMRCRNNHESPKLGSICGDKVKALLGYVLCVGQGMDGLFQITLFTLPFHIGSVLAVDNVH